MSTPKPPDQPKDGDKPAATEREQPGSNDVQHEPDPTAEPIPDGHQPYHPKSPYTAGNY